MSGSHPHVLDAGEVADLLDELGRRLARRGVRAAVFVVGGAAVALSGARPGRLTQDVDVVASDELVLREAEALAVERELPPTWLNSSVQMWMPDIPSGVLDLPEEPGLRITCADDGLLLAMKLVAQRAKDVDDLFSLARRLGLANASGAELEQHLRRYYTDEGRLEMIVGPDAAAEVSLMAHEAAERLRRHVGGAADA